MLNYYFIDVNVDGCDIDAFCFLESISDSIKTRDITHLKVLLIYISNYIKRIRTKERFKIVFVNKQNKQDIHIKQFDSNNFQKIPIAMYDYFDIFLMHDNDLLYIDCRVKPQKDEICEFNFEDIVQKRIKYYNRNTKKR